MSDWFWLWLLPARGGACFGPDGQMCPAWVILRCLALSRTALQEHQDGHVQEMFATSPMQAAAPLKAREGRPCSRRTWPPGWPLKVAAGQARAGGRRLGVPASDLLPPVRSGQPSAGSDTLGSSRRLSHCCLPWGDTPFGVGWVNGTTRHGMNFLGEPAARRLEFQLQGFPFRFWPPTPFQEEF